MRLNRHTFKTAVSSLMCLAVCLVSLAACTPQRFVVPPEDQLLGQKGTYSTDVDVLWVVDSSGSMQTLQDGLAAQAPAFVNALDTTGLNYQMAVTTMDMNGISGAKGRFLYQTNSAPVLKKGDANLIGLLMGRLKPGIDGSPLERGMESVRSALTGDPSTTTNAGFLRPNSLLVLIFLTNENDKSTVFDDVAFLDGIRPATPFGDKSWIAHFIGVLPDDDTCKTTGSYTNAGYRYMNLANVSGGISVAVCDADLARAITGIKARLLEVITEWKLKNIPKVETIQVWLDGKPVAQSATNGWTYFDTKNSIRFHGSAIPRVDQTVTVHYDPAGIR